jgi:hypothetical protein
MRQYREAHADELKAKRSIGNTEKTEHYRTYKREWSQRHGEKNASDSRCRLCEKPDVRAKGLCSSCYQAQWRATHPERIRALARQSYERHHEARLAALRAYRHAHRDIVGAAVSAWSEKHRLSERERSAAYHSTHRDEHNAMMRDWYARHAEEQRAYHRAYYREHKAEIQAQKRQRGQLK